MYQEDLDYIPSRKSIGEFKLIKLPRGDEKSHTEFQAVNHYGRAKPRGWSQNVDANAEHQKKEEKLLKTELEE